MVRVLNLCLLIFLISCCYGNEGGPQGEDIFLIEAVQERNIDVTQWLLRHRAYIDVKDTEGKTPLMRAAVIADNGEVMNHLLNSGADANVKHSASGKTALHFAAEQGVLSSVKVLYNAVSALNKDNEGRTALHEAVMNSHHEVVSYLLDNSMDPYTPDNNGLTIIHLAAMTGQLAMLNDFKTRHLNLDYNSLDGTALITAILSDQYDAAKFLLENGANTSAADKNLWTPLHAAAYSGSIEMFKLLLKQEVILNNENSEGKTPLFVAVERGNLNITKYLADSGSDVSVTDNNNNTLLHAAATSGSLDTVKVLVESYNFTLNAVNRFGWTPVISAALGNQTHVVKYLVSVGSDVNQTVVNSVDEEGKTPLFHACEMGNEDSAKELLRLGGNLSIFSKQGNAPFHAAAINSHVKVLAALLDHGADINIRNVDGKTALYQTVELGNLETFKYLLKNGANASFGDNNEKTVMHLAAKNGNLFVMKELVKVKGIKNAVDKLGRSPLWYAVSENNKEAVDFLIRLNSQYLPAIDVVSSVKVGDVNNVRIWLGNDHTCEFIRSLSERHEGRSFVHYAVLGGVAVLDEVMKHRCFIDGINKEDESGKTPARLAAIEGKIEVLKKMVSLGGVIKPDLSIVDAVYYNNVERVKLLVDIGYDVNTREPNGLTILAMASYRGRDEIVRYLIDNGADIDALNPRNHTALHYASSWNRCDTVKLLIDKGANVNAVDYQGKTPLDLSESDKCKQILRDHGGKLQSELK